MGTSAENLSQSIQVSTTEPAETKRPSPAKCVVSALLSGVLPGVGQLLTGARRQALIFLAADLIFAIGLWGVRLPLHYWGDMLTLLGFIGLAAIAACTIIWHSFGAIGRMWLALVLPCSLVTSALTVVASSHSAGFREYKEASTSMEPTVLQNDDLVADQRAYRHHQPATGDLVVFWRSGGFITFKRVIAVPGQTISSKDGRVALDGKILSEPYTRHDSEIHVPDYQLNFGPIKMPEGKLFVMGDNRDISMDSRYPGYGLVDFHDVVGKALYIYHSPHDQTGKRFP